MDLQEMIACMANPIFENDQEKYEDTQEYRHFSNYMEEHEINDPAVYIKLCEYLINAYNNKTLGFEQVDWIINDLWSSFIEYSSKGERIPEILHDTYDVFDGGEYHQTWGDKSIPVEDYIADAVTKLAQDYKLGGAS